MIIVGFDPGFANFGYGVLDVGRSAGPKVLDTGIFETSPSSAKRKVLSVEDNARRTREIAKFVRKLVGDHKPFVIAAEAMSHPPSSSSAAKMAMAWGVIITVAEIFNLAIVQASPQEIKKYVCCSKSASKEDVQKAVDLRLDGQPADFLKKVAKGKHEHAYDALAAALTALDSDLVRMVASGRS